VATSGTHDTEPMAIWWENATPEERQAVLAIPSVRDRLVDEDRDRIGGQPGLPHAMHEALLESLYASGANLLILPVQDVFGWRDRINQPATIGDGNWTWRLPWPCDRLGSEPAAIAVGDQLREWSARHGR
jgi:4-alpha-glucanotransferase